MNNYDRIQKTKEEIVRYADELRKYEGNINKWKVIKELGTLTELLGD